MAACLTLSACGGGDGESSDSSTAPGNENLGELNVPSDTKPYNLTAKERYNASRQVCYARGPSQVKLEFTQKGKTPEEIARAFSQLSPQNVRKATFEGCLAGFKASKRK